MLEFGYDFDAWIGGTDAANEGTWTWSNGVPFEYNYWADSGCSISNSDSRDCMIYKDGTTGRWDDKEKLRNGKFFFIKYSSLRLLCKFLINCMHMLKVDIFDIFHRTAQTQQYPNSFVRKEHRPVTFGTVLQEQSMLTLK